MKLQTNMTFWWSKRAKEWFCIKGGLDKYDHRNSETKVWVKCKDKLFPQTGFFCMHFGWLHEGLCVDLRKGLSKPWYFDMKFNSYEIIYIWNLIRINSKLWSSVKANRFSRRHYPTFTSQKLMKYMIALIKRVVERTDKRALHFKKTQLFLLNITTIIFGAKFC